MTAHLHIYRPDRDILRVSQIVESSRSEGPGVRFCLWLQGCELRCPGCCNPEMFDFNSPTASDVPVAALVDQLRRARGIEGITLLGGEPFHQAPAAGALAAAAQELGLGVVVFTGYEFDLLSGAVSVSGSGSDQRAADGVRDSRERERPAVPRPLTRPLSASRVPPTNSLTPTLTPTRPATRDPLSASRPTPSTSPAAAALLAHTDLLISGRYVATARSIDRPWVGSDNQQVHLLSPRYQGHPDLAVRRGQSVHVQLLDGELRISGWPGAGDGVKIRPPQPPGKS